jgi:tRNA(Arg) A34 adenosine deaminase TadA
MIKENKTMERGHDYYMKSCIDLALVAKARGDSPVGAVVVQE